METGILCDQENCDYFQKMTIAEIRALEEKEHFCPKCGAIVLTVMDVRNSKALTLLGTLETEMKKTGAKLKSLNLRCIDGKVQSREDTDIMPE